MTGRPAKPAIERFEAKVDRSGGPDACHLWTAGTRYGYGHFATGAHRFAYELANGPIPAGMLVLHNCDVRYPAGDITSRRCVNPAHLRLGTNDDNMRDMAEKGRASRLRGESSHKAKLTDAEYDLVRRRRLAGEPLATLASEFGIAVTTVCGIAKGRGRAGDAKNMEAVKARKNKESPLRQQRALGNTNSGES